jgi:hypothetical protein
MRRYFTIYGLIALTLLASGCKKEEATTDSAVTDTGISSDYVGTETTGTGISSDNGGTDTLDGTVTGTGTTTTTGSTDTADKKPPVKKPPLSE